MMAKLFNVLLFLCILECNQETTNSKPEFTDVLCRETDIDSIKHSKFWDCYSYMLIDDPCLEDIQLSKNEEIFRILLYESHKQAIVCRINKTGDCIIKTIKKIPYSKFGVFAYLFQKENISFCVEKKITDFIDIGLFSTLDNINIAKDRIENPNYFIIKERKNIKSYEIKKYYLNDLDSEVKRNLDSLIYK